MSCLRRPNIPRNELSCPDGKYIYLLLVVSLPPPLHSPCDPDSVPPSIVHPGAVPLQLRRAAPQVVGKLNRAVIKTFPLTNRHVSDDGMESTLLREGTKSKLIFIRCT